MKWIDLFQFLNKKANDINNLGEFDWQSPVVVYDAKEGKEYTCDTLQWILAGKNTKDNYALAINTQHLQESN